MSLYARIKLTCQGSEQLAPRAISGNSISVVMSVHNNAHTLPDTLNSILRQEGVNLEFIVIDDGSTDQSLSILLDFARGDSRLKVLRQDNRGLTRSLIRGCESASGEYIARQDAGDISFPGRLKKEISTLVREPDVALVSCGARFIGPAREFLYEVQIASKDADAALRSPDLATLRGPSHHGSSMFRKDDYVRVGGYRPQFRVAQDLDLWTRLVDLGRHEVVQEVLYEATLAPRTISSENRAQQDAAKKVIAECMCRRMATGDDSGLLEQAARTTENRGNFNRRSTDADFYYFLASCLRRKNPRRSRYYLFAALRRNPFHIKALIRAVQVRIGAN